MWQSICHAALLFTSLRGKKNTDFLLGWNHQCWQEKVYIGGRGFTAVTTCNPMPAAFKMDRRRPERKSSSWAATIPPVFQQALQEQNTARPTPRGSNGRRPRWPLLGQNTPQRDNNGPHGAPGSASNGHSVNIFWLYSTGLVRLLLGLWTKLELCFKIKACHCVSLPKQWLLCFRSLLFTPLNRTSTLCGGKCGTKPFLDEPSCCLSLHLLSGLSQVWVLSLTYALVNAH